MKPTYPWSYEISYAEDITASISRKALELGFTSVGFAKARDYPEYEREVRSRPDYETFTNSDDSLLIRLSRTKTLHPWAESILCATLGFSNINYPENLLQSVARTYLARVYSPQPGTLHHFQIDQLANHAEEMGIRVERNQFCMPQRIACAEAGIVTLGNNNFAYTNQDGSFCILVTFLMDIDLADSSPEIFSVETPSPESSSSSVSSPRNSFPEITNGCPDGCTKCVDACPTHAILAPRRLDLTRCILFNNQRFQPGAQEAIWDEMEMRIHGCDICQEVCPRNKKPLEKATRLDPYLESLSSEFDLEKVLLLDAEYYERTVNPIMYNYIKDMDIFRRNAAVALGNTGDPSHLPALREAKAKSENPHLLEAIDWAIVKLQNAEKS